MSLKLIAEFANFQIKLENIFSYLVSKIMIVRNFEDFFEEEIAPTPDR